MMICYDKHLLTNFFHTISGWGYPVTLHFRVTAEPFSIERDPLGCMLFIDAGAVIQELASKKARISYRLSNLLQ